MAGVGAAFRRRHPPSRHALGRQEVHRMQRGGMLRAGVFGVSDGLMTNMSLVLGVAAANGSAGLIRLAGIAGMVAGSCSMAAGEYLSNQVTAELITRDVAVERDEISADPEGELDELIGIYEARGMAHALARQAAVATMSDPATALRAHANEELGLRVTQVDSRASYVAGLSSFLAFAVGALLPLAPWFLGAGNWAVAASVILGTLGAIGTGMASAIVTGTTVWSSLARQVKVIAFVTLLTVLVGHLVGVASVS